VDGAGGEVGQRRAAAAIGHDLVGDAGAQLQQLDAQMPRRAVASGCEIEPRWRGADQGEKLAECRGRHRGVGGDEQRAVGDKRDVREVLHHVEGDVAVDQRHHDMDGGVEQQRGTVRPRPHHLR